MTAHRVHTDDGLVHGSLRSARVKTLHEDIPGVTELRPMCLATHSCGKQCNCLLCCCCAAPLSLWQPPDIMIKTYSCVRRGSLSYNALQESVCLTSVATTI